jgi:hypothetical protein
VTWLRIDDKFEDNAKVEPLSDAAHRLWMRAACWCQKPENIHTKGFVPKALLEVIAKRSAPKRKLLVLAEELVNANAGGTKERGLWIPEEHGWRFHDWWRYQSPTEGRGGPDDGTPHAKAYAGRIGGQRSAEVRRARFGSAQPKQTEADPEADPPKQTPKQTEALASEAPPEAPRSSPEAPDPVPDPDLPETNNQGPDRSRPADDPGGRGEIPCPADLELTEDQRRTLESSLIPGWAIDLLTVRFRANYQADPDDRRPKVVWRKCLSKAVAGGWNNAATRPRKPEADTAGDDSEAMLEDIRRQHEARA